MKSLSDAQLHKILSDAFDDFEGDTTVFASAMGALMFGRYVGWQGLRVIYSRVTFNKYERLLKIKFRDVLPPRGPDSDRLRGIKFVDGIGKFWQAIASGMVSAKEAALTV